MEVTAASDIYSIGVILYEALTGRVPFEGDSAVAVAMKQVSEAPLPPSSINPKVSPALDAVVLRALAKDPGAPLPDADAFIAALDAAERRPSGAGRHRRVRAAATGGGAPPSAEMDDRRTAAAPLDPDARALVGCSAVSAAFFLTRETTGRCPGCDRGAGGDVD